MGQVSVLPVTGGTFDTALITVVIFSAAPDVVLEIPTQVNRIG